MRLTQRIWTTAAAAALSVSIPVWAAQQPGLQMGTPQTQPASQMAVAECARAQPLALQTIDAANLRLEAARQDNSPRAMRAAVDDLQDALRQLRAQLAACAALQAAAPTVPKTGHAMPTPQQPASASPSAPVVPPPSTAPAPPAAAPKAPTTVDPHAGHTGPAPAKPAGPSASRPGAAGAKPGAAAPKPLDPHAGHAMPSAPAPNKPTASGEAKRNVTKEAIDPVSGMKVDPATAPSATYKGKVYYFASAQDRLRFIRNPETYLKKGPRKE